MGGTMRLGSRRTYFQVSDSVSAKLYVHYMYLTVDEVIFCIYLILLDAIYVTQLMLV